jgi:hypothetical protein
MAPRDHNDRAAPRPGDRDRDRAVLAAVDGTRADGAALLRWWRATHLSDGYARKFELIRTFNAPEGSFAFFDEAALPRRTVPVMGLVEDVLYDRPKTSAPGRVRDELREFVLHYFLRVSAFERPEAYADPVPRRPGPFEALSWCPRDEDTRAGFGYTQHFFKRRDTGEVGAFPEDRRERIVDLREVGRAYEWLVLKVRIHDFNLAVRPWGQNGVQVVVPLREESYLLVSPEFLVAEDDPEPGVLGRYGFGYAFIPDPVGEDAFAYGPGDFAVSFQLVHFRVLASGEVRLALVFVANRPDRILDVTVAPLDWGVRLADLFTFGFASRALGPARGLVGRLPPRFTGVDPVGGFVTLANLLTGGVAGRDYCVTREQLEKRFLVQHFMQHYQMVTGSLLTWRQHPSWLEPEALPDGLKQGEQT